MFVSQGVYGLRLAANIALPGLFPAFDSEACHVQIWLKDWTTFPATFPELREDFYCSSHGSPDVRENLRVVVLPGEQYFGFFYADGTRLAVDRRGSEVWIDWPENYTLEDACTYLLGPVMGFVLRLRGIVCLHASAVAVCGKAIALVGFPGAGKSTTAAAFACAGFPVVSDDVVALADKAAQFFVQPGYPRVNLWPDSVRTLFGSEGALPRITPTWEKRYLPLDQNGHRFGSSPLPLGAIYILDSRDSSLTAPIIQGVPGQEAFMALTTNTYVNYLLDQDMRRREFDILGRVVSQIPVRRVHSPAASSVIFDLCEAIAADAKRVMTCAPANAAAVAG